MIFTASDLKEILSRKKVEGEKFVEFLGCMLGLKSKGVCGIRTIVAERRNEDLIAELYLRANQHILARRIELISTQIFKCTPFPKCC